LLELYAADLGRRTMSVADLAVAMGEPQSTMARWIVALEERGLVMTRDLGLTLDLSVELSAKARTGLKRLTDDWTCAFLST
jgi:DNA-binding IclR family transcriptional regulator